MALVIDAEGHFAEPITLWDKYVDPSMRDKVRIAKDGKGNEWLMMGDVKMGLDLPARDPQATAYEPGSRLYSIGDTLTPQGLDQGRPRRRPYTEAHPGGFDAAQRLIVHDTEGIDGAVLFSRWGSSLPAQRSRGVSGRVPCGQPLPGRLLRRVAARAFRSRHRAPAGSGTGSAGTSAGGSERRLRRGLSSPQSRQKREDHRRSVLRRVVVHGAGA
jgi:hypothetical protein